MQTKQSLMQYIQVSQKYSLSLKVRHLEVLRCTEK
jgi:hypothetical protein